MLIQIRAWLPFFFFVMFSSGDVLELWVLPVARGGGCFGGPII